MELMNVITIKEGRNNTYCHTVEILSHLKFVMGEMKNPYCHVVQELL